MIGSGPASHPGDFGMANGTSHQHAHEIRLGLVMYGGVSLAVYINGVANELFRASRGRGVYRLLKELTDSDFKERCLVGKPVRDLPLTGADIREHHAGLPFP